jgi:hypothetical protein
MKALNAKGNRALLSPHPDRVYVGRGGAYGPGSKWGNPFKIDRRRGRTRAHVIAQYRAWIVEQPELMASLDELCGKDLVCWCAPEPCHADVLLELANR